MRSALIVALLCVLTACSDAGEGRDDRPDPCSLLSPEDASRIVGVSYARAGEALGACFYQRPVTDLAFALSLKVYDEQSYDEVLGEAEEDDQRPEEVEVAGADRAVVLHGQHRGVLAERDDVAYGVTLAADQSIAVRLLSRALGGEEDLVARPVDSPCRTLTPADLDALLDAAAEVTKRRNGEAALKSCTWRVGTGEDRRTLEVAVASGRGPATDWWRENFFVGPDVDPEPVDVAGADEALLVIGARKAGAGLAVSRDRLSWAVAVSGDAKGAARVAMLVADALLR